MKTRWTLMAIMAMLVATVVTAQPFPPGGPNAVRQHAVLVNYLALTPDQIASWQQIATDEAAAIKPLAANARDLQKQLDTAMQATAPDPLTVGKLMVSIHSIRDQIRASNEAAKTKRLAVLTADQKVKFDAFHAALAFVQNARPGARGAARMGGRMGGRMGR